MKHRDTLQGHINLLGLGETIPPVQAGGVRLPGSRNRSRGRRAGWRPTCGSYTQVVVIMDFT